jgi:glycosyltransferase involved in cell wall biosynthesis
MKPFVSVVIPTYNREHCILDAIVSAWAQKHVDVEIIVVDDASKDKTKKTMSRVTRAFPNIHYVRHWKNKGVSAARNAGIRKATGEYIAFLDSDDLWHTSKLAKQFDDIKACAYAPESVFSFSYYENYKENHKKDGGSSVNKIFLENNDLDEKGRFKNFQKYSEAELEKGVVTRDLWFGIGSTLFAHRDAIKKNGMFDETIGCGEDTEYLIRHLVGGGKIRVVPEVLMGYLRPDENKPYPSRDTYQRYLVDKYKCGIAKQWGETVAEVFIDRMREDYLSRSIPLKRRWNQAADEIIPLTAPCRGDFPCALRGKICKDAAKPVARGKLFRL